MEFNIIEIKDIDPWIEKITIEKLQGGLELIISLNDYEFNDYCYTELFVIGFDWAHWNEGRAFLKSNKSDFNKVDEAFCYKLLTGILKSDRFNDGLLLSHMENGNLIILFERLIELKLEFRNRN